MNKKPSKRAIEDRDEPVKAAGRYTPHHLPWDRFSKPKLVVPGQGKPSIVANNPDLDNLASQVWKCIKQLNEPPFLFRREGRLCRIEAGDNGAPVPVTVDVHRMNFLLVEQFDWIKIKRIKNDDGEEVLEEVSVRPPKDLAAHLVADPDPPVPTLLRIVTAPVFSTTGRLPDKPGDYADGMLYLPPKSLHLAELPECPSNEDIRSAVDFICQNLLADFHLAGQAEIANAFAALLTPFVREMIDGPTPLFWIDKSKGGSGGTLLSSVIAAPLLGAPPSGISAQRDEAEWNRVILSTLLRSPNVFFIDNCNERLTSEALAHAITAARYEGRIIGSSKNESAEVRCLWLINGNNLRFGWELARRVVRIRIDPSAANPDQRRSRKFVHPHLLSWVIQNRASVLYNLLLLVRAWQARGCPPPGDDTPEFGSFDSWRKVVGGILGTAGITSFLANLEEARQEADEESADLRAFVQAWRGKCGTKPVSVTELLALGRRHFELPKDMQSAAIKLGKTLSKYEHQVYAGYRIQRGPQSGGRTQWQLREVGASQ